MGYSYRKVLCSAYMVCTYILFNSCPVAMQDAHHPASHFPLSVLSITGTTGSPLDFVVSAITTDSQKSLRRARFSKVHCWITKIIGLEYLLVGKYLLDQCVLD